MVPCLIVFPLLSSPLLPSSVSKVSSFLWTLLVLGLASNSRKSSSESDSIIDDLTEGRGRK